MTSPKPTAIQVNGRPVEGSVPVAVGVTVAPCNNGVMVAMVVAVTVGVGVVVAVK